MSPGSFSRQRSGRANRAETLGAARVITSQAIPEQLNGTPSEFATRLASALSFAERTVETADREHELWRVDLGQVSGFEKMILEASLFAAVAARDRRNGRAARQLAMTIRRHYDSADALAAIMREPGLVSTLGTALIVLDQFGLTSRREQTVLAAALASPYLDTTERVPFRLLDRSWVLHLTGLPRRHDAEALRLSAANRRTHPIYMTRDDAYGITHSIIYATDFGAATVPTELRRDELWEILDASLAWCLASGDFDLVGEILLSQMLLHRCLSEYGDVAWHVCRTVWDSLGFLPCPSLSADAFEALDDEHDRQQYAFFHMYHTVFVSGLLCNALRMRDVGVPVQPRRARGVGRRESGVIEAALSQTRQLIESAFDVDGAVADEVAARVDWAADVTRIAELTEHWLRGDERSSVSADAVRRMATDAFIIESARNYELAGLAAGLRLATASGRLSPTAAAGAGFLARQIVCGAIPSQTVGPNVAGLAAAFANALLGTRSNLTTSPVSTQ